jgi:hypothetical protein
VTTECRNNGHLRQRGDCGYDAIGEAFDAYVEWLAI